jgi:hypothetical protein
MTSVGALHTSFFPDLIQVNLLALEICDCPSLLHGFPATGVAACTSEIERRESTRTKMNTYDLPRITK